MHKDSRHWSRAIGLVILISIVFSAVPPVVYATGIDGETENNTVTEEVTISNENTIPEQVKDTTIATMNIASVLNTGDVTTDVASYINYKSMTKDDYEAFKWSFILSQLAKPFSESISDVLQNDIIIQMRDQDLIVTNTPDILDGDYVYTQNDKYGEYKIEAVHFKKVYETITRNLRYNLLLDSDGNAFTVKTLLSDGVLGKTGYISDMIFTNKDSPEIKTSELKNNISSLYTYDGITKASELKAYIQDQNRLIGEDPMTKLKSQRRLVPIFIGSGVTELYIQMGMMIYCKETENMNLAKFIELLGDSQVYVDSFGNIVYYDVSASKYKTILSNANNTLLTTNNNQAESVRLYSDEFLSWIKSDEKSRKHLGFPDTSNEFYDRIDGMSINGWNEKTFLYNKLMGSVYSSKVKVAAVGDEDGRVYDFNEESDRQIAYYRNYVGPAVANRKDYRNSFILFKNNEMYPEIGMVNSNNVISQDSDDIWNDIGYWFESAFNNDGGLKETVTSDGNGSYLNTEIFSKEDYTTDVLPPFAIKLNGILSSTLSIGDKFKTNKIVGTDAITEDALASQDMRSGAYITTGFNLMNYCFNGLLQTADDTIIQSKLNRNIAEGKAAYISQIPESSLLDITMPELLGEGGGYLEEKKIIRDASKDTEKVFDSTYLLKRDNRLSNRYVQMPKDDFTILFYTWLQDYYKLLQTHDYSEKGNASVKQNLTLKDGDNWAGIATCLNTAEADTYVITGSNMASSDYKLAGLIGNYIYPEGESKDTEEAGNSFANPFTISATVNPYVTLMGLYRNTDPANKTDALSFKQKIKEVDIVNLAQKIEFGIDNPITKINNFISGFMQTIHNAVAVNSSSNMMVDFLESELFDTCMQWYIIITWSILFLLLLYKVVETLIARRKLRQQILSFGLAVFMCISVPYIFKYSEMGNKLIIKGTTQTVIDKSALISTQKKVDTFANKDIKAEQNYNAYRQQFASVKDVFAIADLVVLDGLTKNKLKTKEVSLDDCVGRIAFNTKTEVYTDGVYKWYSKEEFMPVHNENYKDDINLYFYDYLMYKYIDYFANSEVETEMKNTASKFPLSQVSSEGGEYSDVKTKEVADKLSKAMSSIKGGLYDMFNNSEYTDNNDVIGLANLLNSKDTIEGSEVSYVSKYFQAVDEEYSNRQGMFKSNSGSLLSTDNLMKEVGRDRYYGSYTLTKKAIEEEPKLSQVEELVHKVSKDATKRIKELLDYRKGEFSDTALMYVSSLIISEEFVKATTGAEIGIKTTTDIDKIMRVVYSKNLDNVFNQEELLYIVQDSISGGSVLGIFIVLFEIIYMLITIVSIGMSVFVSIAIPLLLWRYSKNKGLGVTQLIGYASQMFLSYLSVFVVTAPIIIASNCANTLISDAGYWLLAIFMLGASILAMLLCYKCVKILIKDFSSLGGAIIAAGAVKLFNDSVDMFTDNTSIEGNGSEMSISDASVDIAAEEAQMSSDAVMNAEYEGQPTSKSEAMNSEDSYEGEVPYSVDGGYYESVDNKEAVEVNLSSNADNREYSESQETFKAKEEVNTAPVMAEDPVHETNVATSDKYEVE